MNETKLLDEIVRAAAQCATIREKTGFWPVLGHPEVEPFETATFSDGESADRFRTALEGRYGEGQLRPAMLAFWWQALHTRTILDDDDQADRVREYSSALRHCIEFVGPASIESDSQLRWELDIAATTRNVQRVLRLLDERKRRPRPDQFADTAVRLLFLLVACEFDEPLPSGLWDPEILRPDFGGFYRVYSLIAYTVAMQPGRVRVPPTPNGPPTIRKEIVVPHVRAIREWLELVKDAGGSPKEETAAIEAWTVYCLGLADGRSGEMERAGILFENAPKFDWPDTDLEEKPFRWQAAAIAYQDGGASQKALACVERWATVAPNDMLAQRKLAELNWRGGRLEEALKAFERATASEEPSDRTWEHTTILQLGLEKLAAETNVNAIERAAERTPLKVQGQRLAAWTLPWFDQLSDKARERFWFGLYAVSSPELLETTGQATWDNAGDNFGEALAFELKCRVFEPFAAESRSKIDSRDEIWIKVIRGYGTLGQLIECLLASLRPDSPPKHLLRARLYKHHKPLVAELTRSETDLRELHRLRGAAQHDTLAEAGVRQLFALVCRIFAAIHTK